MENPQNTMSPNMDPTYSNIRDGKPRPFGQGLSRRAIQRRYARQSKAMQAAQELEFAKTHLVVPEPEAAPAPVIEPEPEKLTLVEKKKKAKRKKVLVADHPKNKLRTKTDEKKLKKATAAAAKKIAARAPSKKVTKPKK